MTTPTLAKETGADRDQVFALRVRRTGQRRATRWHAITEDDKIRQRVAEPTGRSKRRSK